MFPSISTRGALTLAAAALFSSFNASAQTANSDIAGALLMLCRWWFNRESVLFRN